MEVIRTDNGLFYRSQFESEAALEKAILERLQQFVPNLQKRVFPGCGHWVQQERAHEVNAAILAFLRGVALARDRVPSSTR